MLNSIQDKIDNMSENNERNFEQLSDEIKSVDNRLTAIHAGIENKITNMQIVFFIFTNNKKKPAKN